MHTSNTRNSEAGVTLIEVMIAMAISVMMLFSLHAGTKTAVDSRKDLDYRHRVFVLASEYIERVMQIPFGKPSDMPATPTQLTELFDNDDDLGTASLLQLKVDPLLDGHSFRVVSDGVRGEFMVKVSNDLNGDGSTSGAREGRNDMLRIEVRFDGRLVLETVRAADPAFTQLDNVNYLSN